MNQKEIERSFVDSGWEVCESSSPHLLLVGNADDLSILAYRALVVTEDPLFELIDRRRGSTYWTRVVPTPERPRCCWRNAASSREASPSVTGLFELPTGGYLEEVFFETHSFCDTWESLHSLACLRSWHVR
jgi:hypothetical protein